MNNRTRYIARICGLLLIPGLVHGAILASWENNALAGNEVSVSANFTDSDLGATPALTRGAGLGNPAYANVFGFNNHTETSLTDAISQNEFVSWTVTAGAESRVAITNITLRLSQQNSTVTAALMSDVTGFSVGDELDTYTYTGNSPFDNVFTTVLSGLTTTSSIEFRLYVFGAGNPFEQGGIGLAFNGDANNDLQLDGTITPIPEPSSLALLGIGICLIRLIHLNRDK